MSDAQCKLVYFNRRETDIDCDKIEYENEIFSLRNLFESNPNIYLYEITYYAPVNSSVHGLYKKQLQAKTKKEAEQKFYEFFKDYSEIRIKNIKLLNEVVIPW